VAGLVFAYGGLLIDLVLGFLLLWRRTFWLGAAIALVFHGLNANLFQIGIFPFFMIGALMLFPRPNWPRLLLRRTPHQPTANNHVAVLGRGTIVLLVLLHGYLVFQLAFPLRHWLYPGDVNWTEEGHRFSWRMMLREKDVDLQMVAIHPQTGQQWQIFPEDWLTSRQHRKMRARPDMIHQFAHYIADEYEQATGVRPQVKVRAWASLNGRPAHDLIDPNVDLAAQQAGLGPATWITATAPR
jgi:vitamin K-dependent gamma-carboxylase